MRCGLTSIGSASAICLVLSRNFLEIGLVNGSLFHLGSVSAMVPIQKWLFWLIIRLSSVRSWCAVYDYGNDSQSLRFVILKQRPDQHWIVLDFHAYFGPPTKHASIQFPPIHVKLMHRR